MSKYIILIDYKEPNPYTCSKGLPYVALFKECTDKYADGRPYFGGGITKNSILRYSYTKEELPAALLRAQQDKTTKGMKYTKKGCKIFVLKTNSPKLVKRKTSAQYDILTSY